MEKMDCWSNGLMKFNSILHYSIDPFSNRLSTFRITAAMTNGTPAFKFDLPAALGTGACAAHREFIFVLHIQVMTNRFGNGIGTGEYFIVAKSKGFVAANAHEFFPHFFSINAASPGK